MSEGDPDPPVIVQERINVDPKYIGQDQPIYVPGQHAAGGLGEGGLYAAAGSLAGVFASMENRSLRYVSITIQRKGDLCRALVVSHYPVEAYISYQ
jgi:hypothetical protein